MAGREEVWLLEQEVVARSSSKDVDALERVLKAIDEVTGVQTEWRTS